MRFGLLFIAFAVSAALPIAALALLGTGIADTPWFYPYLVGQSLLVAAALTALVRRHDARSSNDRTNAASATAVEQGRFPGVNDATGPLDARTQRQARALSALAEIDRAILSRTNVDIVLRSVLRNVLEVIGCDAIAITVLAAAARPETQTLTVTKDHRRALQEDRPEVDHGTLQFLMLEQDGFWVDEPSRAPFLVPLMDSGAQRVLLLPVFLEGKLGAVLSVGLTEARALGDEQRVYARDFADRLGVVLTAGLHADSLHVEGHHDVLTTLPNRRFLELRLAEELSRARREESRFALLFVGLDEFKKVNDTIGHGGGDAVLREAGQRLKGSLREQDIVVRFSGDQFVALLPTLPSGVGAGKTAEKLIAALAPPFSVRGEDYHLGASIGISIFPDDGQTPDNLLRSADLAMSRAKAKGGGEYVFFEEQVNADVFERVSIERDLRQAIAQNQLEVMYQAQVNLRTGKLAAAEALVRWRHPQRGFVSPNAFIGIAEQSTLIENIGGFMRRAVCEQYRTWEASGILLERISVNVSSREVRRREFVQDIETLLRETGMRPFCLELEITESMLVDDSEHVLEMLRVLHDKGIRIAIDDFGTGYSSLAYLRHLPFDVLKIDRAFVRDIGVAENSGAICTAIVAMAHSLGKEVVAEGVENEMQRRFLADAGCEIGQGYLWSTPKSVADFAQLAREGLPGLEVYSLGAAGNALR